MPRTLFENDPAGVKAASIPPADRVTNLASIAVPSKTPGRIAPSIPASVPAAAPAPTSAPTSATTNAPSSTSDATLSPPGLQLWLVARDAFTVVAHWTPPGAQLQQISANWGPGTWRIRVWMESVGDVAATDVALDLKTHPDATHQFIPVLRAGQPYVAEIGFRSPNGHWRAAARSGPVATPSDHGGSPAAKPSFSTYRSESTPTVPKPGAKNAQTSTPASQSSTSRPARVAVEHRLRLVEQEFLRHTPASSAEVVKSQKQIVETVTRQLPEEGSREGAEGSAGADATAMPSSAAPSARARPRGFWFEVNAELIVHGRTEPNAKVTLGGRPVKLRGDGSFTFRFALPDGDYSLPAVAVSAEGDDQRAAELRFIRNTQYEGSVGTHPIAPQLQPPVPDAIG